jgi:hypothetical protein
MARLFRDHRAGDECNQSARRSVAIPRVCLLPKRIERAGRYACDDGHIRKAQLRSVISGCKGPRIGLPVVLCVPQLPEQGGGIMAPGFHTAAQICYIATLAQRQNAPASVVARIPPIGNTPNYSDFSP